MKIHLLALVSLFSATLAHAHGHHAHADAHANLKLWTITTQQRPVSASFLMSKNDTVFLETADGTVACFPVAALAPEDQRFVRERVEKIERLNQSLKADSPAGTLENQPVAHNGLGPWTYSWLALLMLAAFGFVFTRLPYFQHFANAKFGKHSARGLVAAGLLCGVFVLFGFKKWTTLLGTDPLFIDSAFQPFKPKVATRWDAKWFYVESQGIPDHEMMTGIVKWQQQVPLPQCYLGTNAWQIPLNPELAATPIPVNDQHFLRGAVAIAANGVPIFNPYTNTGLDALVDGQLDDFGGHSGRADDYHYHIAPLHLDPQTPDILPIAFGLDGFAVYGALEPDGAPMRPLDANHGHFDAAGTYHYHGTKEKPYMIGNMVGKVTEDATLQLVPQPRATPVRPSLTPLTGAAITDCTPKVANNGYVLTYTRNGQTYKVDYDWTNNGVYTYRFIAPTGTTTETYNGFLPCKVPVATGDLAHLEKDIEVFPNPNAGTFSVKINALDARDAPYLKVFDTKGRLVFQKENIGATVEVGGLAHGVYVLKIGFEKGEVCRKVVVQ